MERRLYQICLRYEITYITIAHRPSLRAFHNRILSIGDGQQGYRLETLERAAIANTVMAAAAASVVPESVERSMKTHADARNQRYRDYDADVPLMPRSTWARCTRIWNIARPERWLLKLGALSGFLLLQVWIDDLQFQVFSCRPATCSVHALGAN